MNVERFEILAEAYGADLTRWPAEERAAAADYLAANPRLLEEEAALDAWLNAAPAPKPSADLLERLAHGAPRARAWSGGAKTWLSAGLVAACILGVVFGASLPTSVLVDPSAEALAGAQTAFDTAAEYGLEEFG